MYKRFIPFLEKMAKSIHWLEHTLCCAFSTLTFSYLCCWPHQIGNMFSIYTELAFVALFGSLGCLAIFFETSSNTATPRNIKHRQRQSLNDHGFAISISDRVFKNDCTYVKLYCTEKHSLASAELTAVGRGCSIPAVRVPL